MPGNRARALTAVAMAAGLLLVATVATAAGKLSYGPPGGQAGQFIEIGQSAVRMSHQGRGQWMLYRDGDQALYIVNDRDRSYQRVDAEMLDSLSRQIQAMQAQVEAQLAQLPPEQREMMRGMMPKLPNHSQADYSVEFGDEQRKVSGFACRPLVVKNGGEPVEEICLASIDELKLSESDLNLLKRMGDTMGEMAASLGAGSMAAVMEASDGVPVEHRKAGAEQAESVLLKVEREAQPAGRFTVPEGYEEKPLIPGGSR